MTYRLVFWQSIQGRFYLNVIFFAKNVMFRVNIMHIQLYYPQICWSVSVDSSSFGLSVVSTLLLNLPPSKHRWVTSGVYLSLPGPVGISQDPPTECIVCGDRKGSVFMYIVVPTEKSKSSIVSQYSHCKLCLALHPLPPLSLSSPFSLLFLPLPPFSPCPSPFSLLFSPLSYPS